MKAWELDALMLSAQIGLFTVLLCTPLSVLLAAAISRARWAGHWLLDALILLPMALPPSVVGFALLMGLRDAPWVSDGLSLYPEGAVLVSSIMTLPLMVRIMRPAFEAIEPMLSPIAQSLGVRPIRAWLTITLPLVMPAVVSAMALGLVVAWGESGATMVLAAGWWPSRVLADPNHPVPLAVLEALHNPRHQAGATRLALMGLAMAFVAVLVSEACRRHWQSRWGRDAAGQTA